MSSTLILQQIFFVGNFILLKIDLMYFYCNLNSLKVMSNLMGKKKNSFFLLSINWIVNCANYEWLKMYFLINNIDYCILNICRMIRCFFFLFFAKIVNFWILIMECWPFVLLGTLRIWMCFSVRFAVWLRWVMSRNSSKRSLGGRLVGVAVPKAPTPIAHAPP